MKIKTWIKYMEAYLPTPRCRKNRYKEMEEYIDIELKEISINEVKPAFKVDEMIYYLYNEELFIKANKNSISNFDIENPLENLKYCNEHCSSYFGFNDDDSREKMINKANERIKRLLLIDNELYVKTYEPAYTVHTFGLGNNHAGIVTSLSIVNVTDLSLGYYFDAYDREKAIEHALQVAINRGDTHSIDCIKNASEIIVLLPEAVKHRTTFKKEN
jgi:hypothetical protein